VAKQTIGRINKGLFSTTNPSARIDVKLLIHALLTSVLLCEVTKTLRVPPSPALI
jgi:hypothetical protein